MKNYFVLLSLLFFLTNGLKSQTISINKDYNNNSFSDFANSLEKDLGIQFYYFPGWLNELSIKQEKVPTSLEEILGASFENTDYHFFINQDNQVIISLGQEIQSELIWKGPEEFETEIIQESSNENYEAQFTDYNTEWVIIGNPSSPEQKPKVRLSGRVFDADSGAPLEAAIVYIVELQKGTSTDSAGFYSFDLPQGRYEILYQSVGLKEKTQKLQLYASGALDIQLEALILNIEEITVRANKKAAVEDVALGVEQLKTETIKELPTLLGEIDVLRSALLLPGVQSVGEFSSGINVRGGGADQNLVLFNGAPVFNSSHLFGFSSSFSADVVEGFELYKSSIPAKFGGRISSVLDVQMKDGDLEDWSLSGGISPVTGRLTVQGPLVKKRSSVILSARSTYADWILDRIQDAAIRNSRASYSDLSFKVKTRIAQNDYLEVSAYLSDDDFQLNGDTSFAYQNKNVALHYQHEFGPRLFGTFSGIYSQYQFEVASEKLPSAAFDLSYNINYTEGKAHFSYAPSDKHQVNFGLNIINYDLAPGNIKPKAETSLIQTEDLERENALEAGIYLSDEWTLSESFSISMGLRFAQYFFLGPKTVNNYRADAARTVENIQGTSFYDSGALIQNYGGPEYRLSLRYILDDNTSIKAAANRNRQFLSMLFNSASISPTATWKLADQHILPQTGDQFSLGLFRNFWDDQLELSLEAYYKAIQDMLDYKAGAELLLNENLETAVVNGQGRAYGIEFLAKKNGRRLNGWLSYTYSRTQFRSNSEFLEDQINQGEWYPSNFDKPHDLSLVTYYKASKRFSISTNLTYSTGRPITIPVAQYWFANGVRLHYSRRNEFRVPDYFRWDISMNLDGNHKKKKLAHSSWSLSLYNVTGRKNVYSIFFESDGTDIKGYKLSIFGRPFLTLTYNFKI